jgi:hypothetical protein
MTLEVSTLAPLLKVPEAHVALVAEQPSDRAGLVVVIDVEAKPHSVAQQAQPALLLNPGVVLLDGHAVVQEPIARTLSRAVSLELIRGALSSCVSGILVVAELAHKRATAEAGGWAFEPALLTGNHVKQFTV